MKATLSVALISLMSLCLAHADPSSPNKPPEPSAPSHESSPPPERESAPAREASPVRQAAPRPVAAEHPTFARPAGSQPAGGDNRGDNRPTPPAKQPPAEKTPVVKSPIVKAPIENKNPGENKPTENKPTENKPVEAPIAKGPEKPPVKIEPVKPGNPGDDHRPTPPGMRPIYHDPRVPAPGQGDRRAAHQAIINSPWTDRGRPNDTRWGYAGFEQRHYWDHYHPTQWWVSYDANYTWYNVSAVTCQAVFVPNDPTNPNANAIYTVNGVYTDYPDWRANRWTADDVANTILDEALSQCYSANTDETGNLTGTCQPIEDPYDLDGCFLTYGRHQH
jgi:hypothetical protein